MQEKDYIAQSIDRLFAIKKDTWIIIGIFVLGLLLRLIAARNLTVSADDMHHVIHAVDFLAADRLITYDQSAGLWHAFTSVCYNLFGTTQFASRLASILFGSGTVLVVYLLTKEFFDKKIAYIAAFIMAIAPFHIKNTIAEMDIMAMFFALFAMLVYVRAFRTEKQYLYAVSGLLLGLAIYTKTYPLLFIPSLVLFFIYLNKKEKKYGMSQTVKYILLFLVCAFIFTIPALTHNYLLYKDKGFMDLQFTRTLGLGKDISEQYYGWDHQFNARNDWSGLILGDSSNSGSKAPTLLQAIDYIRKGDPIVFWLGLIGIVLILLHKTGASDKKYLWFFFVSILFALPFLASIILLPKHYIFLEILLVPLSAIPIRFVSKRIANDDKYLRYLLIILLVISLVYLGVKKTGTNPHFYGQSAVAEFMEFKERNIPKNALIVADSRIYRGQVYWMSHTRPYIEGTEFLQIITNQDSLAGGTTNTKVFFVECASDDCGWGTIQEQPQLNESMELLTEVFKKQSTLVKEINEPDREQSYYPFSTKKNTFNVYTLDVSLKKSILPSASKPRAWFLYTIGYKPTSEQFDYYYTQGFFDQVLDDLAHAIVYLALWLSMVSIAYLVFLSFREI